MDQPVNTISSEEADGRKWIGRIIMAVILGEAIWSLIVSVMNNLVVPWLGDVMGPSSGVPTSFSQRPYDYPDLFVSVLELGIAGLVAAVLNYFFERPRAGRVKPVKRIIPTAARVVPPAAPAVVPHQATMTHATLPLEPVAAPPVAKPDPVTPPAPVGVAPEPPAPSTPSVTPPPVARPLALVPPTPPVAPNSVAAKPLPPAPKAEPAKPKKPKQVYYNIVGEPMPSDED
jgi:hypothetical protein